MCDPNLIKQVLFLLFWCTFPIFTVLSVYTDKKIKNPINNIVPVFVFGVPFILCFVVGLFLYTYMLAWCGLVLG